MIILNLELTFDITVYVMNLTTCLVYLGVYDAGELSRKLPHNITFCPGQQRQQVMSAITEFVCCTVLMLMTSKCSAQDGYSRYEFPNPMTDFVQCGQIGLSSICDPSKVLTTIQGE